MTSVMNYRKFGNTSLEASEIGFGGWAIGGNVMIGTTPIGWGPTDDKQSITAIRKALNVGINFFDTADFYGLGHSEKLLGKELANKKDVIIATKVGHRTKDDTIQLDYSKSYIIEACHKSLQRLKRDTIDFYQLHSARMQHLQNEECVSAMEQLKQEGKIRYWGLSLNTFQPAPEAEQLIRHKVGDGFQLVFNLINQKASTVMEQSRLNGYGIIARMPLQFGLLTGKISNEKKFNSDDHRHFRLTSDIITDSNHILDEKVWYLCEKYDITKVALALSFICSFDAVSTVIPGMRTAQQVIDNTSGITRLDKEDVNLLVALYDTSWQPIVEHMEKLG